MVSKRLRIWFEKINGFIKIYDGIRYLALLVHISNDDICEKKFILQIVLIIIWQESKLIDIVLYLLN